MKEDIVNRNSNDDFHGYNEWYVYDKLGYRGVRKNGWGIGYEEWHCGNYSLNSKAIFYIK